MKRPSYYGFFAKHIKEILSNTGYTVASTLVGYGIYQVGETVSDAVHKKLDIKSESSAENDVHDHSSTPKQ